MPEPTRVLQRSPQQGRVAGVCAGLAEYINVDVTIVRIIFIVLAFITGGGFVLVYIITAIVMPSGDRKADSKNTDISRNIQSLADDMRSGEQQDRLRNFIGVGLVLLGAWLFLGQLFPGWLEWSWGYLWPVVLILLGIYIVTRRS